MRTSLLPGLLDAVSRAARRGERNARLFTIGAKFLPSKQGEKLPEERLSFAAVLCGVRDSHLHRPQSIDVFDAKGIALELVVRVTQRDDARIEALSAHNAPKHLHPRGAGKVIIDNTEVAIFGLIHPDVRDAYEIGADGVSIEVDLVALEQFGIRSPRFRPIPRLPAVTRDISLEVHDDISAGDVGQLIAQTAGELCESVELFDVFRGGKIPAEHRALAFHVVYRDPKAATDPDKARTLTAEDVDKRHEKVVRIANERLAAKQR
jgi:phenylalanyl-tRNA synthetase beta chain